MDSSELLCADFDDEMMKVAVDYASTSVDKGYGPFGAVIVDELNNIVGGGYAALPQGIFLDPHCHYLNHFNTLTLRPVT